MAFWVPSSRGYLWYTVYSIYHLYYTGGDGSILYSDIVRDSGISISFPFQNEVKERERDFFFRLLKIYSHAATLT